MNNKRVYNNDPCDPCKWLCFPCLFSFVICEKLCICCCCCIQSDSIKDSSNFDWKKNKEVVDKYNGKIYGCIQYKEKEEFISL
jgi:hypothetical protein|tara:strand:- start:562 stop:810 length:249 start_codon:yes stop_codon:yes gene_type:complete